MSLDQIHVDPQIYYLLACDPATLYSTYLLISIF